MAKAHPTAHASRTEHEDSAPTRADEPGLATTVTTIGAIGVIAALFDIALIPGIMIGVAAAYAPKYIPRLGDGLQPLFDETVRAAYKIGRGARSAVAEAQERISDIAAEIEAEEAAELERT